MLGFLAQRIFVFLYSWDTKIAMLPSATNFTDVGYINLDKKFLMYFMLTDNDMNPVSYAPGSDAR